jgi:DNA polymerase elongation subunit (family B)
MEMDKLSVLSEIKPFLEGYNDELKYLVNVETDNNTNIAECVIHEPNKEPKIVKVKYEPFMYMKDLAKTKHVLYEGHTEEYMLSKQIKYGVTITKLKTGNQKRLVNGYCYKLTSKRSYNDIVNYIRDGGINPYEKLTDDDGRVITNAKGESIQPYRDLFYSVRGTEQFFISNQTRLFKGFEEYKDVHKLTFDIETTGLRYQIARMFTIGVRDNRGFETILEVSKLNDDESEIRLIQDFFNLINLLKPAVISGYNSEFFDFEFILGRAKILKMDLTAVPTSLKDGVHLKRRPNCSVKYGNTADKFTATEMWGYSVIDIIHAAKKTAAVNTEVKATGLKYIAKHEKIAKPNRTYIKGEDNSIGRFYAENKMFVISDTNTYIKVPSKCQETAKKMYLLQASKGKFNEAQYKALKAKFLSADPEFVDWFRKNALPNGMTNFISGKNLVKQYLLDDLWETEQVDELYNQSSFMVAKIVPTTYQRVCTMGTAAIWNLLLTAWSYENDLAIPISDKNEKFSGGLARCYKVGYSRRIKKIDYASLYPMIQLSDDVFPIFDITGVMKKLLLYLTTTRNIYKKLATSTKLNEEEVMLLKEIDHEVHIKYLAGTITNADTSMFKIKQLPIKILNNSLFGALGSAVSFNWSDNVCAARITCTGRLHLRHAIHFFTKYDCVALLAVTDGINFNYPEKTKIRVTDDGEWIEEIERDVEEMWQYSGKKGLNAIIEKYNREEMASPYMSVDDDGDSISCLNLSRINYATLSLEKDKKTNEMKEKVKLTGNTIKSKVMPEYIEEFIDKGLTMILHGQGKEFVEYYYDYCDNIRYMQIPLKKIASKSKIKMTLTNYGKRGKDKNGRDKGIQAHMELLIEKRNKLAEILFEEHKETLNLVKIKKELTSEDKARLIANYMPPEPELDSVVYYVNSGTRKSHGDSRKIVVNKETGETRFCATLIDNEDLIENPNMTGVYNYEKYLSAFNKRVAVLLAGFDPEIQKKIIVKVAQKDDKNGETKRGDLKKSGFGPDDLQLKNFDLDNYGDSMFLEDMEVNFWNKTGYDPRLIWNGFKMNPDHKVHYEIYEGALKFLNDKMVEIGKPKIKSINEKYGEGDLVLIKDGIEYHVGSYNGTYIQIIRENIDVPKSELELELDRQRIESEKKLEELRLNELSTKSAGEMNLEAQHEKHLKYFSMFKQKFGIPLNLTMEALFAEVPNSQDAYDDFVAQSDGLIEEEANEYLDGEDFSDDE